MRLSCRFEIFYTRPSFFAFFLSLNRRLAAWEAAESRLPESIDHIVIEHSFLAIERPIWS